MEFFLLGFNSLLTKNRHLFCLLVVLITLIVFSPTSLAKTIDNNNQRINTTTNNLLNQALGVKLYENNQWHALLHYRKNTYSSGFVSEADDHRFFISPEGKTNPKQELIAFIMGLQSKQSAHIQCQFPARYYWFKQFSLQHHWKFQIQQKDIPCPTFEAWRKKLNAHRVTLVLASSYLNSPSSMFGHTFLRLDADKQANTNLLLSYTVSYAADDSARDNELMFAYRGIFGGYPGVTSVESYYQKIKMYSSIENRDLWEYQLNLTEKETAQLVRHTWEIKDKRFDYYFFDENCAYRLLSMIDVARPGTNLLDEIHLRAIPSDTVKLVIAKHLVDKVVYRPSSTNELKSKIHQLTEQEKEDVLTLADHQQTIKQFLNTDLNPESQARVLDTTFEYLRYNALKERGRDEQTASLSHQLLVSRSKLNTKSNFKPTPIPSVRNDQGHKTLRLSLFAGRQQHTNYLQIGFRPAYHDITDPIDGFIKGSQLQFLNGSIRYYDSQKKHHIELDKFNFIDIRSLTPRDDFFSPLSWQVSVGAHRIQTSAENRFLTSYLNGGAGFSYALGSSALYAMGGAELNISSHLQRSIRLGPRLQLGWMLQTHNSQTQIEFTSQSDWVGHAYMVRKWHLKEAINLGRNLTINLGATHSVIQHQNDNDVQLGMRIYY
jgi:hypothetical protein